MVIRESRRRGTAMLLILAAILALGLFLVMRPLRLESPASGSARAMLRLDHALGATLEPVDTAIAIRAGLPRGQGYLVVTSVASGGPAAAAGLRVGDILQAIGGRPPDQLSVTGYSGPISIWRGGKTVSVHVDFSTGGTGRSA